MSVLIKGMEMPETCEKCRMNVAMFLFSDGPIGHCMLLKGRPDKRKCPLVPVPTPHGDLIDRDVLAKSLGKLCDRVCQYSKAQRKVMCGACPLGDAFPVVEDDAIPIIEAEEVE